MKSLLQAASSISYCSNLLIHNQLHNSRTYLKRKYKVNTHAIYSVFRETTSDVKYAEDEVTLLIGFRLFLIGNNSVFHWLFQKLSILATPVWVGFKGFRKKLWMVNPLTNSYLGIYRFQGERSAQIYREYITSVLEHVSIKGSVWSEIIDQNFDRYLESRDLDSLSTRRRTQPSVRISIPTPA